VYITIAGAIKVALRVLTAQITINKKQKNGGVSESTFFLFPGFRLPLAERRTIS
tara:strand:- start:464 stop:625 length:162 start_codon:yes stop_codon:yes gene_type:complete